MKVKVTWTEEMQYTAVIDIDESEFEAWRIERGLPGVHDVTGTLALREYLRTQDEDGTLWQMSADANRDEGEFVEMVPTRVEKVE